MFQTRDGDQLFVGVTSNNHWARFCEVFDRPDLLADQRLATNEQRVAAREWFIPIVGELLARYTKAEIAEKCEAASIPYAPVAKVADLLTDPHLNASGALVEVELGRGVRTRLPRLPVEMSGAKPGLRRQAPAIGEHSDEILRESGLGADEIGALRREKIIR